MRVREFLYKHCSRPGGIKTGLLNAHDSIDVIPGHGGLNQKMDAEIGVSVKIAHRLKTKQIVMVRMRPIAKSNAWPGLENAASWSETPRIIAA